MARIPVYDRQGSLRVGSISPEAPAKMIDASSFTNEARAMSQFGVTVQNIAEDIIKVKADQEFAKAKIEGYKVLQQIEAESVQDDDFQNFEPKYSKRIKDTQEAISKNIRNPQAKQAFQQDFELKSNYSFYDIMADGRKRFIAYDKDLMAQETVATKERYFSASTIQEKQNAKDELAQIFSRRAENKVLNKAEAANLYKKEIMALDEGQVKYDILTNPQKAKDFLLRDGYENLGELKKAEYLKDADDAIEKQIGENNMAILIRQAQKENEFIDKRRTGQLSIPEVETARVNDEINAKVADSMIKSLKSPKAVKAATEIKVFDEIMTDITNRDISATEIRQKIFDYNAKGKLSEGDLRRLLYAEKGGDVTTINEDYIQEQETSKEKKKSEPKKSFWGVARDVVRNSGGNPLSYNPEMRLIIDRVERENAQGEQIIVIAKDENRKQILKDRPDFSNLPEGGHLHYDKYGNKAIIYPDGTYEEVQAKTGEFVHKEQRKKKETK